MMIFTNLITTSASLTSSYKYDFRQTKPTLVAAQTVIIEWHSLYISLFPMVSNKEWVIWIGWKHAWHFGEYRCITMERWHGYSVKAWTILWSCIWNSLCAKFRGIPRDTHVVSKSSYWCSFYRCQIWGRSSSYIEYIYITWNKVTRQMLNFSYNLNIPANFVVRSPHTRV